MNALQAVDHFYLGIPQCNGGCGYISCHSYNSPQHCRLVYVEKKKPQHVAVDWAENGKNVCYYDNLPAHHRLSRYYK